jgi:hypothetical protein
MKIHKKIKVILLFIFILTPATLVYAANFSADILAGYSGGPGFQINFVTADFAQGFPLNVQLGIAYSGHDPGNAADARKIFINDATNGDPEKSGRMWDFRLDFLYKVKWLSMQRAYVYGGPRYSQFTANFVFVGGNEDFDISSDQWGIGFGIKSYFAMGAKVDFVATVGFDYYLDSALYGHDTVYNPDGENVNPRNGYTYEDADNAVSDPNFQLRLLLGVNYHF